jgi:hypothetical protein
VNLPLSIERLATRQLVENAVLEPICGVPFLVQSVRPRALKLHDLCAVNQAEAVVGNHAALVVTPPREGPRTCSSTASQIKSASSKRSPIPAALAAVA